MHDTGTSPYPNDSWITYEQAVSLPRVFCEYVYRHDTHRLVLTTAGHADIRSTTNGVEAGYLTAPGDLGFFPCDHARHSSAITSADGYRATILCLPEGQLRRQAAAEGMVAARFSCLPCFRDPLIKASIGRLLALGGGGSLKRASGPKSWLGRLFSGSAS